MLPCLVLVEFSEKFDDYAFLVDKFLFKFGDILFQVGNLLVTQSNSLPENLLHGRLGCSSAFFSVVDHGDDDDPDSRHDRCDYTDSGYLYS